MDDKICGRLPTATDNFIYSKLQIRPRVRSFKIAYFCLPVLKICMFPVNFNIIGECGTFQAALLSSRLRSPSRVIEFMFWCSTKNKKISNSDGIMI